jgi:hypothetical protein
MPSPAGIAILLVFFAAAFIVARVVAKWFWKRGARRAEESGRVHESRQVRRARERRERGS